MPRDPATQWCVVTVRAVRRLARGRRLAVCGVIAGIFMIVWIPQQIRCGIHMI
jgi:hypothetical protein